MNKLKYYAFDLDDNLAHMPTKVHLLKDWEKDSVSTADYAKIRMEIWNNWFQLLPNGESFHGFLKEWDEQFKKDLLEAKIWPSWPFFVQCINKGNIFSMITARWHSRRVMYETIEEMIRKNHNWICSDSLFESMHFFLYHAKKNWLNINLKEDWDMLLKYYLSLIQLYPVSNENVSLELWINWSVLSPEKAKVHALSNFIDHVKITSSNIIHKDFSPTISIWFSDDDEWTIEIIRKFLKNYLFQNGISPHLWNTSSWNVVRHHI